MPKRTGLPSYDPLRSAALSLIVLLLGGARVQAQACKGADNQSAYLIGELKAVSASAEEYRSYQRRDLKIPVVDTSTIVLVNNQQTCNKVLTTFNSSLPPGWPTPLPSSLYVAKVGSVYVGMVLTPDSTAWTYAVVDSKYKLLAKYSH